ncbi:MAG: glycerate kinase, partial [Sulfobacillus thermotolerans]|nr:glycerate kinase [Sulfobacillus thermotolerans]
MRTLSVADGGEGTSQVLLEQGAVRHEASATNIYGEPLQAFWVQWKNFALVEASIGSRFVPPSQRKKDGMQTTSWGTGQLIAQALNHPAVQTVYVALGGSGSTDGGMGMMAALGARFYDARGRLLLSEGKMIAQVAQAVLPTLAKPVIGLYDVAVPLYGPRGCVQMFGRQKGVAESALDEADKDMMRYSKILHQGGHGDPSVPGAGSAGGMGFGILALGGQLQSGAEMVAQWTHLDHWIQWADCIVTGEGRIDDQTYEGKVVGTIVRHAQRQK